MVTGSLRPFIYRSIPLAFLVRSVLKAWSHFVLQRSDIVRVVSRSLQVKVQRVAPGVRKFAFPTYTDLELFLSAIPGESTEAVAEEPKTVVYVGTLSRMKGLHYLVDAAALERRVAESRVSDAVEFADELPFAGLVEGDLVCDREAGL